MTGLVLYRRTTPLVKAALDKPVRDSLIDEARELGPSKAFDLAIAWLAMDEARSTVPDAPPAFSSE